MKTEHWVEYHIPGSFFSEEERKQLKLRDVQEALEKMPKYAFAFELYDVELREGRLEDGERITDRKVVNRSKRYFPDGQIYTVEDVKRELGSGSILQSNMECNDWPKVVKTRKGNFQPFENAVIL